MRLLNLSSFKFNQTLLLFFTLFLLPCYLCLPDPDATLQPIIPYHSSSSSSSSSPAVIPAFPEQANVEGCPLNLSDEHYQGIKSACGFIKGGSTANRDLHRSRCCPVLAAWLYSAYSATALSGGVERQHASSYDMPLLPDDSETCASDLGKDLRVRGIELMQPNETCDLIYCYCGIRLHPLTCPESFSVAPSGDLVGDETVQKLERDCLSTTTHPNGFPGLGGCSKCLHTLLLLKKKNKASNSRKTENRNTKIHNKDCELMGLTWLLAKNRSAYIHTVSGVLTALMLSSDGSDPQSCTLNSDGKPLAVDSSDLSDPSSSSTITNLQALIFLSFFIAVMHFTLSSTST